MSAAVHGEPSRRPGWLVSGSRIVDLSRGTVGRILAVGRPFNYATPPNTACVVPVDGGEPWEAEIGDLRPAGPESER